MVCAVMQWAMKVRQNIECSEYCSEVQWAAQLEKGTCVVKCIVIHPCEETDLLRQGKLGPNSRV